MNICKLIIYIWGIKKKMQLSEWLKLELAPTLILLFWDIQCNGSDSQAGHRHFDLNEMWVSCLTTVVCLSQQKFLTV